jgi:hypothetical protein
MLPLGLASKLGFHPLTKAILVAISTSPQKEPHSIGLQGLKIAEICNVLIEVCFLYVSIYIGNNLKCFGLVLLQN